MKRTSGIAVFAAAAGIAGLVGAQDATPDGDFSFKRVKVPGAGSAKRIMVQIDPDAEPYHLTPPNSEVAGGAKVFEKPVAPDLPETPSPVIGPYAWYWDLVSPSLLAASPARLEAAVNNLANGPGGQVVAAPRLQSMQGIAQSHGIDILTATIGTNVSPALVLAVIGIESSGRPTAVSSAGAQGLMQLIPATAERFGVTDSMDGSQNIKGGVAYLDWLMKKFDNDAVLVLAAYNAGENAVLRHEGVPPFSETRAYVPKVLAAWKVARGMCLTPPQLISDGCVFAVQEAKNDS